MMRRLRLVHSRYVAVAVLASVIATGHAEDLTHKSRPPVLMISVDGMRPDYVTQADIHKLKIPVLRGFMREGTYADGVIGVVPTLTFPSHATLVTGVWPIEHGIYNNTRFDPFSKLKDEWYWFGTDFKVPTLWQAAAAAGITTASVFWPTTVNTEGIDYLLPAYPAPTRDYSNLIEALSRPDGYLKTLEKQVGPFYIFDAGTAFDEQLTKTSIALIRDKKPGFMTLHLVSLDHYEHLTGPFSPESDAAVEALDGMIGKLVEAERSNDSQAIVVVVSDHGFAATHTRVNLLIPFVQAGLIQINKTTPREVPTVISWKATLWNADGSAYIVLHNRNDKTTLAEVEILLEALQRNPLYGISRVLTHDQIMARGGDPDASFLVEWNIGFSCGEALEGDVVKSIPGTGTHGYLPDRPELQSSYFALGSGIASHCDIGTMDMRQIAPTVAGFLGVSLPDAKQPAIHCGP